MRGSPLIDALVIAVVFLGCALSFRHLASGDAQSTEEIWRSIDAPSKQDPEAGTAALLPLEIRCFASSPWSRIRIEHLGEVLVEQESTASAWVGELAIPEKDVSSGGAGIEFWIEAAFPDGGQSGKGALGIEVTPEAGLPITRTLWSSGGGIADSAVFVWEE